MLLTAVGGRTGCDGQTRSRSPEKRRALGGAGVQVLGDGDVLEQLERLEGAADPGARACARGSTTVRPSPMPSSSTRPSLGFVKPVTASMRVVLPAPLGPMSPTTWRGSTRKLTPSTAVTAPNRTVRSWTSSVAGCTESTAASTSVLGARLAPEPNAQLADATLVVEHDAGDAVRVQDHDEDQRDAAERHEPRARGRSSRAGSFRRRLRPSTRRRPNRAPSRRLRRPRCRPC